VERASGPVANAALTKLSALQFRVHKTDYWPTDGTHMEPQEAMQLGLFGEVIPTGFNQPGPRGSSEANAPALDHGGKFQSFKRNNQDALAAVTVMFNGGAPTSPECIRQARELVTGQAVADLREVALAASFIAGICLRAIDRDVPGAAVDLLEELGLTLAEYAEPPVGYLHGDQ
jgi:hypothetical protein